MPPSLPPTPSGPTPLFADAARVQSALPPAPVTAPYVGGDPAREYLQFIFGVLSRRRWFLVSFVAIVVGIAAVVANEIKPRYAAETQLVLQAAPGSSAASGIQALLGGGSDLENDTEAAILISRTLADRVVAKLQLQTMPFFAGPAPGPSEVEKAAGSALDWLTSWIPQSYRDALTAAPPAASDSKLLSGVYDAYFRNLTVTSGDRSRVITIRFVADNPTLAATIANTLAQIYIEDQTERRSKSSTQETSMLDQRLADLRLNIEAAQKRIEAFQSKNGVVDASGVTALQRQAAEYSQQLLAAQLRRADLETRASQLQQLAGGGGAGMADSAVALESPNIQRLRDQEAAATRQIADLSAQYRDDHPRMQQARAELKDVRAKIADEMRRLLAAATNQAKLAQEQEAVLQSKLDVLKRQVEEQMAADGSIRLLEADLKTNSELYAALLVRSQEASAVQQGLGTSSIRIISPAVPADRPFFPNKPILILAAAAVGTMIGILLAFVLELLDVGFRTRQQIEGFTGLETVASIPKLAALVRARRVSDLRHILRDQPAFAEAVRYVRVSLSLAPDGKTPVRRILVTSSLPGEGKTFTARALAVTFALGGKRVVTVDCDLRQKPRRWARQTDTGKRAGLADLLVGQADIDGIVGIDPATGLHHIDCGDTRTLADAPIMLESPQMRQLLRTLAERYDMVIIDTPPVRLFPDALILQQDVDKVLFLIRWAKTRREVALDALKGLVQSGCLDPVVGLTLVDPKHAQRFEYTGRLPQRYFDKYPVRREVA